MAIKTFKDIIDSKGYRIDSTDRALFELGDIQSFFGFSKTDSIEFILYDSNDNQLPQQNYGNVRYIPLSSENIKDYFLVAEGTLFQRYQFPTEYFIDAERLIREAGYENGIFKIQITLLNKRVGSETAFDKLWISEISPSRTEVRLFPHENGAKLNPELKTRYGILINDGSFREDVVRYAIAFVEKINPNYIASFLKANFGEAWFNSLITEYQIQGFDIFVTKIYNKFVEATVYEFTNRNSNVDDLNFGKPKNTTESIQLSKEYVKEKCEKILIQVLNKYLMNPVVKYGSQVTTTFDSYDAVEQILQTKASDLEINTNPPIIKEAEVIKVKTPTILETTINEEIKGKPIPRPKEILMPDVPIKMDLDLAPSVEIESPYSIPDLEPSPLGPTKTPVIGLRKEKKKGGLGKILKGVATGGASLLVDAIIEKKGKKAGGLFPKAKMGKKGVTPKAVKDEAEKIVTKGSGARIDAIEQIQQDLGSDIRPINMAE